MRTIKDLHKYSQNLNVLYVEDDISLRDETETLFKMLFKNIDTAKDGQDGLDKYNQNHYDLVITDINMPVMNGIEMCRQIKEINPEQKVSVVSAHDESHILMDLIRAGADGFILKPMHMDEMVTALYPVCRDAYTQIINIELVNELNDKNRLLEQQIKELRSKTNAIETKNNQLDELIQEKKRAEALKQEAQQTITTETSLQSEVSATTASVDTGVLDDYFKEDEDEGEENILFLSDHCADLTEIFTEIPEIISTYEPGGDTSGIRKISQNLSKAASILVFYSPYLDLLANKFSELSVVIENNMESFLAIMNMDPNSVLMLFDAVSADMERYVERFSVESLAMRNAHHIHEPTALSIQQIVTMIVPPDEDEGEMEFF